MEQVYAAADLAVARAGALTLAELAACNLPALLIPYPHAAGDHQRKNAQELVTGGTARMIDEDDLADKDLIGEACALLESDQSDKMKETLRARSEGRRPAVDVIAEDIVSIINESRKAGRES